MTTAPAWVNTEEVQQWLDFSKAALDPVVDSQLVESAGAKVLGALASRFDTSTWTRRTAPEDVSTTPQLVRTIISCYVAAWIYQRAYGEDLEGKNWGYTLYQMAEKMLGDLIDGELTLSDVTDTEDSNRYPIFYPTDAQETDDSGEERKFTMGRVF